MSEVQDKLLKSHFIFISNL